MFYPKTWLALFVLGSISVQAADGWTSLWNGKDLSGWTHWLAKPHPTVVVDGLAKDEKGQYTAPLGERDPLGVFTVAEADGAPAIRISGQVFGELRSVPSLENYHLRLQFKWGEKKWPPRDKPGTPRDSGLLYHVHTAPGAGGRTWARSVELQIQEHDVGDLYAIACHISVRAKPRVGSPAEAQPLFDYDPTGEWMPFAQLPGSPGRCVKQPDNEKPTGEWNTVELISVGEDSLHIVNGKCVMRLRSPRRIDGAVPVPVSSGPIILQSEGAEVYYRAIEYKKITEIPKSLISE